MLWTFNSVLKFKKKCSSLYLPRYLPFSGLLVLFCQSKLPFDITFLQCEEFLVVFLLMYEYICLCKIFLSFCLSKNIFSPLFSKLYFSRCRILGWQSSLSPYFKDVIPLSASIVSEENKPSFLLLFLWMYGLLSLVAFKIFSFSLQFTVWLWCSYVLFYLHEFCLVCAELIWFVGWNHVSGLKMILLVCLLSHFSFFFCDF